MINQLVILTCLLSGAADVEDGTLLILKHSNKPVARWTGSEITHIAIVVHRENEAWVYEATPARVRHVSLTSYYREIAELNTQRKQPTTIQLLKPKQPYSTDQIAAMNKYMRSQVGRRYSIRGYVRDKQSDGIHCAEFASGALAATRRFDFDDDHFAISPGAFYEQVWPKHKSPLAITIQPGASQESWCQRSCRQWTDFKSWCGWACVETWMFCR